MQIQDGGDTPLGEPSGGLTLRRLVMWTLEPRAQLRALAFLTHAARKVYGGACVSSIYQVGSAKRLVKMCVCICIYSLTYHIFETQENDDLKNILLGVGLYRSPSL